MNEFKFKRSLTTISGIHLRHKPVDSANMAPMKSEDTNALRYFRAHLKNRTFQVLPQSDYKDICLTPLIQPIIQPKVSSDDLLNKRLVKKANCLFLAKSGSNLSFFEKNQTSSFILDETTPLHRKKISNDFKSVGDFNEKMKYFSNSMILNSQSVLPIDLSDNSQNLSGHQTKLPYISPNRFEDVLNYNKPSYLNNYRQSGTNQNSFKRTSKNFNVHTYAPRIWLRSKFTPNTQWVKQNDIG